MNEERSGVKSIGEFLAAKTILEKDWLKGERDAIWYRGQGHSWPLVPSLFRRRPRFDKDSKKLEDALVGAFVREGHAFGEIPEDKWIQWAAMRHHGLPTRLLDWTRSPLFALFFALDTEPGDKWIPRVWLLRPNILNKPLVEARQDLSAYLPEKFVAQSGTASIAVQPVALQLEMRVRRLAAQKGRFTAHGTSEKPLETQCPDAVRIVEIDPAFRVAILDELDGLGISETTLFPELDALSRELTRKYSLPLNA